MYEHIMQAGWL